MNITELPYTLLITAFSIGFLGSTHCVAMCGGIAAACNSPASSSLTNRTSPHTALSSSKRAVLLSIGRLISYIAAGSLCGFFGSGLGSLMPDWALPLSRIMIAIMLILMGFYLTQWWPILQRLEQLGGTLWRPLSQHLHVLLPIDHWRKAILVGAVWGWIPCGLVYSALIIAISSQSAMIGGLFMLCFGLGTLPAVLGIGLLAQKINLVQSKKYAGILLIGFGICSLLFQFAHHQHHGGHHQAGPPSENHQDLHQHHQHH